MIARIPSMADLRRAVAVATRCPQCGKAQAIAQQSGARMRRAPEPFDPAKHCAVLLGQPCEGR